MVRLALAATLACWSLPTIASADDAYPPPAYAPPPGYAPAPGYVAAPAYGPLAAPDLVVHRPAGTETRPWEARLGAGVGFGRMAMLGEKMPGVGVTIDVEALRWFGAFGAGLYVSEMVGKSVDPFMSDSGKPVSRVLAWQIEPELAVRTSARIARNVIVGWKATASGGVVVAETKESCASAFGHGCSHVLERSTELGMSAGTAVFAHVGPLALDIGPRMQLDTAGDRFLALQASGGAVW